MRWPVWGGWAVEVSEGTLRGLEAASGPVGPVWVA